MEDDRTKLLCSCTIFELASGAVRGDFREDEFALSPEDENVDHWDFTDVSFDFLIDIHASLRGNLDFIPELWRLGNVAALGDADGAFCLALHNFKCFCGVQFCGGCQSFGTETHALL